MNREDIEYRRERQQDVGVDVLPMNNPSDLCHFATKKDPCPLGIRTWRLTPQHESGCGCFNAEGKDQRKGKGRRYVGCGLTYYVCARHVEDALLKLTEQVAA